MHYHQGMAAGDNTLNALCLRELVRTIAAARAYSPAAFLDAYVRFMTTPGSHGDTYAETFHRMFFQNWSAGRPPAECASECAARGACACELCIMPPLSSAPPGDDGHNVASMGGFVMLAPPAVLGAAAEWARVLAKRAPEPGGRAPLSDAELVAVEAAAGDAAEAQVLLTHRSAALARAARVYAAMLAQVGLCCRGLPPHRTLNRKH